MVLQTKENARVYRCYVQLACGQFGHLIKHLFFYPEFLETKGQRRKDIPYRGVRDSAHFSSHEEKKLSIKTSEQETFAYVRFVFSTICKNNSSMHSELIIQVKCMRELTYLRRDQPATTSQFIFSFTSCYHRTKNFIRAWNIMSMTWHKYQWLSEGTQTRYQLGAW